MAIERLISNLLEICLKGDEIMFIKRSCENRDTVYVCLFGRRFIFRDKKYAGWYRPGKKEK